jgi:tetratricopeptide (TPR) repeat protein
MSLLRKPQVFGALIGVLLFLLVATAYSGVIFLMSGNAWQQAQEGRFSPATFFFERGNYFFGGGAYDLEAAMRNYEWALRFENSGNEPILYQIGRLYFIKGDLQGAVKTFNEQILADPTFMRSYYMRGLTYGYIGDYVQAAADFKKFIEWRPESWAAHNDLVWAYFLAGNYDAAENYARAGLLYNPKNPWLSNALGAILLNQKNYEEALLYLTDAHNGFATMTEDEWGQAYPGNNPEIYHRGLEATRQSVEDNIRLVEQALAR